MTCELLYDEINEDLQSSFDDFFTTSENHHRYNTTGRKSNTNHKVILK